MRQYNEDYAGWAEDTAQAISEGRWDALDRAALAEEVLGLSRSDRYKIESALRIVLVHLLKARYQPLKRTRSWDLSILEHQKRAQKLFRESPSLRGQYAALLEDAYGQARIRAARETGLELELFPETCPYTFQETLGE